MSRTHLSHHALAVIGFSLITVLYTFPTALRLTTHIPGSGDAPWFVWQLWWFKHAIVDLHQSPLHTDLIYYPLRDVPVSWQSPVNELAAIPLQAAFGPVVAYNLLILGTFVLSGYCMYLLILQLSSAGSTRSRSLQRMPAPNTSRLPKPELKPSAETRTWRMLAFFGGLIFAFCSYRGVRALHHLSLATTQWMPLALVLAIALWRRPTVRRAVAAGVGLGLAALSSPYYVAYFLLPVAGVGVLYLALVRRRAITRRHVALAALAIAIGGMMTSAFYVDFLRAPADLTAAAKEASALTYVYTADVLSWLLPPIDNPLWHNVTAGIYQRFTSGYLVESTLFFGWLPLILGLSWLVVRKRQPQQFVFWLGLALLTLILSFGPVLRLWHNLIVDWMPYRLVMLLPGAYAFRAPARIGITTVIACSVLTVFLLEHRLAQSGNLRSRLPLLGAWSALLLVNMAVAFPYPSSSVALPPVYEKIAATPGHRAVLDLPAGKLFQDRMSWAMYYQTRHRKPLVSGYLGRRPERLGVPEETLPFVRRFFSDDQSSYFSGNWEDLIDWPEQQEVLTSGWPEDIRNANALLSEQGIEHVVVHRNPNHSSFFESAGLLLAQGLDLPVYSDGEALLFRTRKPGVVSHGAPKGLDYASLSFDSAFSEPFVHRQGQARRLDTVGQVMFDVPLPGTWLIRGQLERPKAPDVSFVMDGTALDVELVHLFGDVYAFSAAINIQQPGEHTLTLQNGPNNDTPSGLGTDSNLCGRLCLLNLIIMPDQLELPVQPDTMTQFRGDRGEQLDLLDAIVLSPTPANPRYRLLTTWRLPAASLSSGPQASAPTLFVHLSNPAGNTVLQADHVLGEQSLRSDDGSWLVLFDQIDLPVDKASTTDLEARVGLWYPQDQTYLTLGEGSRWATDPSGRIRLGTLKELIHDTSD